MAKIEGEIVIGRPVDVVFDTVADQRNEPTYNPTMTRSEKLTDGPIGIGTRFRATTAARRRPIDMLIEYTAYDRPSSLVSTTRMAAADVHGILTFTPDPAGTLMRWSWDLTPKHASLLLTPLVAWLGRRQERRIWTGLKQLLEGASAPPAHPS